MPSLYKRQATTWTVYVQMKGWSRNCQSLQTLNELCAPTTASHVALDTNCQACACTALSLIAQQQQQRQQQPQQQQMKSTLSCMAAAMACVKRLREAWYAFNEGCHKCLRPSSDASSRPGNGTYLGLGPPALRLRSRLPRRVFH